MIIKTLRYKNHEVQHIAKPEEEFWQALLLDRFGPGFTAVRSKTQASAKRHITMHLKRQGIRLDELIRTCAWRMRRVQISVDTLHGVVEIGPDITLFGDGAVELIDEAEKLWNTAGNVSMDDCYACVAEPIYETLMN